MKKILPAVAVVALGLVCCNQQPVQKMNEVQVIGSHNSYKQFIDTHLLSMMVSENPDAKSLEYDNTSLSDQLSLGLRNLEIDVYADVKGGKFSKPGGLEWAGKDPQRPYDPNNLMVEPGLKVLHMQDLDFRSSCLTLKNCLAELKSWSAAHPAHEPVYITMNAKDDTVAKPGFSPPEKFTAEVLKELDKAIRAEMGNEKLVTPDLVRGKYNTLEEAVLAKNWPSLKDAAGKFVFILDEKNEKRDAYIDGNPSLTGRVLFVNAPAGTPSAAIMIMNDPLKEKDQIQSLVRKGYIVRTRADAETKEARANDKTRFNAACESGAQIITTDYYQKSTLFNSPYTISFEDGKYIRKNPLMK
ncbi:MAG: phosphatidylinositol-specific phospholipase C1-like protein [Bacteroidota bacterium]